MPTYTIGPDPTELAALHEQQFTLQCAMHEAVDAGRTSPSLGLLYTRIALLDAELRRN